MTLDKETCRSTLISRLTYIPKVIISVQPLRRNLTGQQLRVNH
jgi:hypothetical protein